MKKTLFSLGLLSILAASCAKQDVIIDEVPVDPSQKEKIEFSMSDGTGMSTRAGFTEGTTRIVMRIQSDDRHSTSPSGSKYTRVLAEAQKDNTNSTESFSEVKTTDDPRYWDDAYGRFGQLSVYAIAIANKNESTLLPLEWMYDGEGAKSSSTNTKWGTSSASTDNISNNTVEFSVETSEQTVETIEKKDLVYSNNIQENSTLGIDGVYRYDFTSGVYPQSTGATTHTNGRMLFAQKDVTASSEPTDAPGKFDKGHLVFNHALSRITVQLVEGEGFNTSSDDDFKFTNSTNIKLLGMNTTGTLDVKNGTWTPGTTTAINKMAPFSLSDGKITAASPTTAAGSYMAQMLPGYTFTDNVTTTNVMEFEIDNNTYYITQDMLFDALKENAGTGEGKNGLETDATGYTMEQGRNYKFTITVKKAGVAAITATLAKWVDVEGNYQIDNSHITVTTKKLEGENGEKCGDFNFYRWGQVLDKIYTDDTYTANTYSGDYLAGGAATKNETSSGSGIWNTNWYYENNKTAYHFRTLNNLAAGANNENIANSDSKSSFKMVSGAQSSQDYHWGAPMISSATLKYDETNGFTTSLHKGIIAPNNGETNTINITEIHMMSNINIYLKTDSVVSPSKDKGPAAVDLENAVITLTRFAKTASVDMGTGLISPSYEPASSDHSSSDSDCAIITAPSFNSGWWIGGGNAHVSTDKYSYAVVPQKLRRSDAADPAEADCVGLTIKTNDENQYYVIKDLATITASTVSDSRDQTQGQSIMRWYPGHTYNYIITITKTGIKNITCTVANWVEVTAENKHIDLEN